MSIVADQHVSHKIRNIMANGIDPDETAHYELSHLDLHCLQRCLFWVTGLIGLR